MTIYKAILYFSLFAIHCSLFSCSPNPIYQSQGGKVGTLGQSSSSKIYQKGLASYYADKYEGRLTANGEIYSQKKFTAAHKDLPFGTKLKVTNLSNNKSVIVTVNDRFTPKPGRCIDLTKAAARKLDYIQKGLTEVTLEIILD
ncbi:MAG: septal ring lytic transglycosylase RlpA family protein [Calditrichaeota bacterium]|nr:MAG: septal ring lytic transglycosylase RlpA family protein [Calditrichota bacterium]